MPIIMIACLDENDGIGDINGNLLFNIKKDMEHFKKTTSGEICVFGRKTAESLPNKRPLEGRTNIVLSRDPYYELEGFETLGSVTNVENLLDISKTENIYICGGEEIYEMFLPVADKMILTHVHDINPTATSYFPPYEFKEWKPIYESFVKHEKTAKTPAFTIAEYSRKGK